MGSSHLMGKDAQPVPAMSSTLQNLNHKSSVMLKQLATIPLPGVLPGYRESMLYGSTGSSLVWRDNARDDSAIIPRIPVLTAYNDRRGTTNVAAHREARPTMSTSQSNPSSQSSNPPSLVTQDSTNSNSSSIYQQPRTPLESPGDRTLPPIFPHKPVGHHETTLPSIRPPSLSPQTSVSSQIQSPNGKPSPHIHSWGMRMACSSFMNARYRGDCLTNVTRYISSRACLAPRL